MIQPKVEAEIAFVLSRDLDRAEPTLDEVADAIATAHASLEIVDSRIAGWDITFVDTVADNASSGLFALGDPLSAGVSAREASMEMRVNGEVVSTGRGTDCMGDPLLAVRWLAHTAYRMGDPLRAGHVILSGAFGPMVAARPGDTVEAIFTVAGNQVGAVEVRFAA